jgi:hypothetical protein
VLDAIAVLRTRIAERNGLSEAAYRKLGYEPGVARELVRVPELDGNVCDLESLAALVGLLKEASEGGS